MNIKLAVFALLLPLGFTGCQYAEMREAMEEADVLQKKAYKARRAENYPEAVERYAQSAAKHEFAFNIATERKTIVFVSHLGTKLSIVSANQAFCVRPDNNPAGSWERAYALYATSAVWADEVGMLKLKRNALHMQAFCLRPDNNPKGSWEKAQDLYAKGTALAKEYKRDEDQAEGLREQALCLMEGDRSRLDNVEARRLLIKARKLGDEEAAEILAAGKYAYCIACGSVLEVGAQFCKSCGQDQTKKPEPKHDPNDRGMRSPNEPGPDGPGAGR